MKNKNKKPDWLIHLVANGTCECGCVETSFLPQICNAHTHGMEKYGHPDFQMVVRYPNEMIGYVLNTFGEMVRDGRVFKAGDMVDEIFEDCPVRLEEFEETGRMVLRVIIPDRKNRFPEDPLCEFPYNLQRLATEDLHKDNMAH